MTALIKTLKSFEILRPLNGIEDGVWSAERIRYLTNYPNWSLATDAITITRSYELGVSIASSLLLKSLEFKEDFTEQELDRIHHIAAIFLLNMLDKADMWEAFLAWFWFLRQNTEIYLRYDLHILSHTGNEINEFIDDRGDSYIWVHNMYLYNRRRKVIERKMKRKKIGKISRAGLHHSQNELSEMEIKCRISNVLAEYKFKMQAETFWQSFWEK